ncbi:MAG: SDR family NAD(P)-dependent oxidoreductase [Gemmatimonadota bacterium]|jgi:NAD(P)-dependent dehydrogenase (short-subunit alcohol dehydrogenase family)
MSSNVAVVTGGTGALGEAVVETLLGDGWTVHVPVHGETGSEKLASLPGAESRLRLTRADLTDPEEVDRLIATVRSKDGRLDLLCNLVGGFAMGSVVDTAPETWARMMDMNATTTFLAVRAAAPLLQASGDGRIVNVAAAAALGGATADMSAYLAAKSAVVSLTRNLARELAPRHITVNAVAPTIIDTPSNRNAMPDADRATWLAPGEIARVVRFLAGPDAAVVTGNVIQLGKS